MFYARIPAGDPAESDPERTALFTGLFHNPKMKANGKWGKEKRAVERV